MQWVEWDRRADHHRLFAERPGGHRWPVWVELLDALVERGALAAQSASTDP